MNPWGSQSDSVSVPLSVDEEGYLGRECPNTECEGYFKVTPGTGLLDSPDCYCPYCGHVAGSDHFYTQEQIEYAQSIALNLLTRELFRSLKGIEGRYPRSGGLFSIDIKVTGNPIPVKYYREKELETEVVCDKCTLRYAIYGVFAFCYDCGAHNSRQILEKNFELAEKELTLAELAEKDLAVFLVNDALENQVSAFDGFGRETCRVNAGRSIDPTKAASVSFQNLPRARNRVQSLFSVDFGIAVTELEWTDACRSFQKRHLFAHKMGVIDQEYLAAANDLMAVLGRRITVSSDEVRANGSTLRKLADQLVSMLQP